MRLHVYSAFLHLVGDSMWMHLLYVGIDDLSIPNDVA